MKTWLGYPKSFKTPTTFFLNFCGRLKRNKHNRVIPKVKKTPYHEFGHTKGEIQDTRGEIFKKHVQKKCTSIQGELQLETQKENHQFWW
jgi:hypothetical protein